MRKFNIFVVSLLALLSFLLTGSSLPAQVLSSSWDNVPIGGGGRTVGVIGSPTSDVLYLRTDVAGMYKRDGSDEAWTRLTETFGPDYGERMLGCLGLGVHPTDDDILYAALSEGIYRSTDQGRTWGSGPVLNVEAFPNGRSGDRNDRNYGEALVVDPFNGQVVYYGSQFDGLFYSRDGGNNWTQIPDSQLPHNGSRSVVVDKVRGTRQARGRYVYVSVRNQGIYRSTDGGTSFSQWQATLPGGGDYVRWLRQSKGGDLYAAHEKGLARWDGSSWSDVSPVPGSETSTVATDPRDDTRVICFSYEKNADGTRGPGHIYRSRNRGASWEIMPYTVGDLPPWAEGRYEPGQPDAFAIYFDDQSEGANNKAYVCSSYHAWETNNVWANTTQWDAMYEGNEMTINISGVSLPEGGAPYIAGMADVRGFKFDNINQYPEDRITIREEDLEAGFFTPNFTGIDFSQSNPNKLWFVCNKKGGPPPYDLVYRSSNGGEELRYVSHPSEEASWGGSSTDIGGPKIAVSATDPDKAVIMIKSNVRYSHDGGSSWQVSANVDGIDGLLERNIEYEFDQLIKSDRVNGNKFYVYATTGRFFKSTDAGVTFDEVTTAGLPNRSFVQGGLNSSTGGGVHMAVAPGMEEEVWLALGASGIWRANGTNNKTDSFEEITFFERINPTAVTFGKAAPGSSTPTAYVFGARAVDGLWGIWKSEDRGDSWELATPIDEPGQWARLLVGDQQTYGRVYMGDASYGIRVLNFSASSTPADLVVDNTQASVQGQWVARTFAPAGQAYEGADYLTNNSGGAGTVRYAADITQAGDYEVYGRWISTGTRASNVPFVVSFADGQDTLVINQQQDGGSWVSLGTYRFEEGAEGYVEILNEGTDGITIADAVRWEFAAEGIPLRPSGFDAVSVGASQVRLNWYDNASNETGFVLERSTNGAAFTPLDELDANVLTYTDTSATFGQRYNYRIKAINEFGESSFALIEIDISEITIDNQDASVEIVGAWTPRQSTFGGTFIGSDFIIDSDELKGEKSVTYNLSIPVDGAYEVYGRWSATPRRATNVPYIITSLSGSDTVLVDQTDVANRGKWVLLGKYDFTAADGGRVVVSNANTSGTVAADAIRLTYDTDTDNVLKLNLTSMCSEEPSVARRWRVRNPNPFPVTVTWEVVGAGQIGTTEAAPGDSFFTTNTIGGANTTKIYWANAQGKILSGTKASGGAQCASATAARTTGKLGGGEVKIYGNPVRGVLRVGATTGDLSGLRITDLSGRTMKVASGEADHRGEVSLAVHQLGRGVYLLHGKLNARPFVRRVMIEP